MSGLRQVRAENETLKRQLADAQIQIQEQRALADRTRSLDAAARASRSAWTSKPRPPKSSAPGHARLPHGDDRQGISQGLPIDMAVIAPAGVVGRVVMPSPRASKVQLLIDRNAAAGALIERSRAQGVVVGIGRRAIADGLRLEVADIVVGDTVVTSGIDGIYPEGVRHRHAWTAVDKSGGAYGRSRSCPPSTSPVSKMCWSC